MQWLRSVVREVYGLFVDDGSFAAALLAWTLAACLGLRMLHAGGWSGLVLFIGLAVVLAESTVRASRGR